MVVVMIGLWVVCGALLAWADLRALSKRPRQKLTKFQLYWRAFWDFAGLTFATLLALRFAFSRTDILTPSHYVGYLSALYAGMAAVIGIVALALRTLLRRVITVTPLSQNSLPSAAASRTVSHTVSHAGLPADFAVPVDSSSSAAIDSPSASISEASASADSTDSDANLSSSTKNSNATQKKPKPRIALAVVTIIATVLGGVCLFGTWWFLDFFGHMEPEQFMFNVFSPVGGAASGPMDDVYTRPVLLLISLIALVIWLFFSPYQWQFHATGKGAASDSHASTLAQSASPTNGDADNLSGNRMGTELGAASSLNTTSPHNAASPHNTIPSRTAFTSEKAKVREEFIGEDTHNAATPTRGKLISRSTRQNATAVFAFILLAIGLTYGVFGMQIPAIAHQMLAKSSYIDKNYVDPRSVQLTFPAKKRNLIHIYFESVESSYLDKAHGGYMSENLMPDLMKLADEGVHFSNTSKPFGGPHQVFGTSWSSAGMTNMNLGVPVKIPTLDTDYGKSGKYLPGAWGYTDILNTQGYNQELLLGCDAHFGGLDALYTTHGVSKVFDVKTARETGKVPPDYMVWWGFEDNKLYEYAKEEITALAGKGKPFAFIMENADTHFPNGYMEPETKHKFDQQYANVIFHSQKQLTDFVRWIQQQPFAPNTSIVITGDHLSMDPNFFKGWSSDYERTTFNAFLNANFSERDFAVTNRQYAPYDYMPTILSSLGVQIEGNRLALGTNLASGEQTLIERDGKATVSSETAKYSVFYADHLLHDSK